MLLLIKNSLLFILKSKIYNLIFHIESFAQKANFMFILAGNGSYTNRGCEAIVRGTVEILRKSFEEPRFLVISNYLNCKEYKKQLCGETDPAIMHRRCHYIFGSSRYYQPAWWLQTICSKLIPPLGKRLSWREMLTYLPQALAVLSVGGDNYSLDYGIPKLFLGLDDLILQSGKKPILWGASVGPFSKKPDFEKKMIKHLARTIIFARESMTVEYLKQQGLIDNVFYVADPAFMMKAIEPQEKPYIEEGCIGINLSPLLARHVCGGNLSSWVRYVVEIIECIARKLKRTIYLIPHETTAHTDDYLFLKNVKNFLDEKKIDSILIPPIYNAAETKWIIGQMRVFAGARTHATIAAISMGVPTLSIGYSVKAQGLNKDIFGSLDFCISASDINPAVFSDKIADVLNRHSTIRSHLQTVLSNIQSRALDGGRFLKEVILDNGKN